MPSDHLLQCQLPLTLGSDAEPGPDVSIVRRADTASDASHPTTAVCGLAFRVASLFA